MPADHNLRPVSAAAWRPINEAPAHLRRHSQFIKGRAGEYRVRLCQFFDFDTRQHHCWVVACEASADGAVTHYLDQPIPELLP